MHATTKMANLTKFRHQFVDREEVSHFGESDEFDEISPDVKIRANDLKGWV